MTADLDFGHPLVIGFGVSGQATVRALLSRGYTPIVVDDEPSTAAQAVAAELGVALRPAPDRAALEHLIEQASILLPSPGIPADHPSFEMARALASPIRSEFDLAALWDNRPTIGITGTNGKTTVTMMVTDALNRSDMTAAAVGNTEVPLIAAIDDSEVDVFVVEASSFRLAHSARFSPDVATWLNFSPDHLDAHATLEDYELAKASIWADLSADAVVVANAEDPVVMSHVPPGVRCVTFGLTTGDWRIEHDQLLGPDGPLVAVSELTRSQPHDLANACAVAATALAAGAGSAAVAETIRCFDGLPHRLQLVGEWDDVRWYNDSKATVPHATIAATGGFDSVVLIAGGRNKGLDLTPLSATVPPVRAVVASGDAADEVEAVFDGLVAVSKAHSMDQAVDLAANLAQPGDTVLLSPACTSFDWYAGYDERGRDFIRIVTERFA